MNDVKKHAGKKMGLWEAVSLAVGTMIGASIFSIFGVGARIAGRDLPVSFLISGLLAFTVAYSYAKLGAKIISNAGPMAFILKGFGDNIVTGALSMLMWLSYVISIALFVKGFAGYFLPFVHLAMTPFTMGIVEALTIAFFVTLNFFGSQAVGKVEFYIVLTKLSVLGVFIVAGLLTLMPALIVPAFDGPHVSGIIHAAVIFFLSYMGFGLITNASENIENAERNVPRAMYISIIVVLFVYVLVSTVAVGNLPVNELVKASDNALAVAARPALGNFGFILITLGALFSISSALNATLYGGANVAYSLAKDGELPAFFERKMWFKSIEGLYITAVVGLLFALFFNMEGIASITSAVFLSIYLFVIVSHYKLADKVGGERIIIILNFTAVLVAFLLMMYYQWQTQKPVFWGTVVTFSVALVTEYIYRSATARKFMAVEFSHLEKKIR